ncbi:MAG: HNH endonuclease [Syntrophothermus sp.]
MRRVNKPQESPKEVFKVCISNIRDADFKKRLDECEDIIKDASIEFENKVSNATLYTIPITQTIAGKVTVEEMQKIYNDKMVKKDSPGRRFYDALISVPKYGRCPICSIGKVTTLDHHLPQSKYPALTVSPVNLIPMCFDCNKIKLTLDPKIGEEELLHPYFDDIENDYWLYCNVVEIAPGALIYFVDTPMNWGDTLKKRVEYHFKSFHLADLYSLYAAEALTEIRASLSKVFISNGLQGVRDYLKDCADSIEYTYKNSWRFAMYRALASNDWFCGGGFAG